MMKRLLCPALLALGVCSGAMAESWQQVGYNEMMTVYIDTDSIRQVGLMTYLKTKVVPEVKTNFTHGINREAYNCGARLSAIRSMTSYKGRKVVDYMAAKKLEWEPVQPNGVSGLIYRMVCNRP